MAKKIVKKNVQRHWGISVLSILGYIGAVGTMMLGLLFIAGSAIIGSLIAKFAPEYTWMTSIGIVGLIFLGLIFAGLAVLDFYIARGLWNGKNWARIFLMVLIAISALSSLAAFELVSVVVDAALIWYLGFYKPVLNYFK